MPFAPGTTTMLFSPLSETRIGATPDGPSKHATASVPTPAPVKLAISDSPKTSVPTAPTISTWIAKPRHGHCLIRAFAARGGSETFSDQSLAGERNRRSPRNEVHVDAADHDDRLLLATHYPILNTAGPAPLRPVPARKTQTSAPAAAERIEGRRQTHATQRLPQHAETIVAPWPME